MYDYDSSRYGSNSQSGFEIGINKFVQGGVVTAHVAHEDSHRWDNEAVFSDEKRGNIDAHRYRWLPKVILVLWAICFTVFSIMIAIH